MKQLYVTLAVLVGFSCLQADSIDAYVGYADNLRATAFFPSPWSGDSDVALFAGGGAQFDAGAIRFMNNGPSSITITSLSVNLHPANGGPNYAIWGGSLPAVIPVGQNAIFTQNGEFDFDTSDFPIVGQDISNNCSTGPLASTPNCVNNSPIIMATIDGMMLSFTDTGHVLDTGGFDANCCLPNGNESLQWRLVGTSGVNNPGGATPEPGTMALIGSGLLAVFGLARRKRG